MGIRAPPAYLHTPSICFGNPKLNLRATRDLNSFVDPEESKFYGEIELLKEKIEEEEEEDTKEVDGIGDFKLKQQVEDLGSTLLLNGDGVEDDMVPVEESSSKGRELNHVVGDVVLVENESILENEIRMAGLEALVGYKVVTPNRRNIGKVRGYSFHMNSGAVESVELASFGVSIIPSSLVSTYGLVVEDVLEVISDTVIVHEAAASNIQRLTKGFWGNQTPVDEYSEPVRYKRGLNKRTENDIELELPMDYL